MKADQELRYSNDREALLSQLFQETRKCPSLTAEALEDILEMLGYRVEFRPDVAEGKMAYTDFEHQVVVVASDMTERLAFPQSAPGVLRSSLAHELGHIRLHAAQRKKGIFRKCWDTQAHEYAMVFLMPRESVLCRAQVRILQRGWVTQQEEIWNLVADLGQEFAVNGSFMSRALVAYGVIKMNRKTRVMRPCVLPASADQAEAVA